MGPELLQLNRRKCEYHHPVGEYSPFGDSPYGCGDMSGNVWEWTRSIFLDYPYDRLDGREHLKLGIHSEIAVRGGAFNSQPRQVRTTCRDRAYPGYRKSHLRLPCCNLPRL